MTFNEARLVITYGNAWHPSQKVGAFVTYKEDAHVRIQMCCDAPIRSSVPEYFYNIYRQVDFARNPNARFKYQESFTEDDLPFEYAESVAFGDWVVPMFRDDVEEVGITEYKCLSMK